MNKFRTEKTFAAFAAVLFVCGTPAAAADAVVEWNSIQQRMSGFGASCAWTGNIPDNLMRDFYSVEQGCGFSLIRMRIAPDGSTSAGEIAVAKKAQEHGATVWAAPWSPPGQWKTNNSDRNGGSLLPARYQDWADRLATYAKSVDSQGIRLKYLSAQNEPNWTAEWETCRWTPTEMATFIGDNLGPALEKAGVKTRIMSGEAIDWNSNQSYGDAVLNNPNASKYVDIIPTHSYGGEPDKARGFPYLAVGQKGKELWETEVSIDGNPDDPPMKSAITIAKMMHNHIVNGPVSAWHHWWLVPNDGNNGSGSNGLLLRGAVAQRGYVMGNYSRFVRPGYQRVATNDNPSPGIWFTAYRSDSLGKLVVVAINENTSAKEQKFVLNGVSISTLTPWETSDAAKLTARTPVNAGAGFTYLLPANSVTSFVGSYPPTGISLFGFGTAPGSFRLISNDRRALRFEVGGSGLYSLRIFSLDGSHLGEITGTGPGLQRISTLAPMRGIGLLRFSQGGRAISRPLSGAGLTE